ncbi:MAG: prolipoprotein diacylglyceryl transferase [Rhodobacteraceae bacterium]|uniref:Phosphatidylglycerol--prolipoprotein diacylglyceryl transferase n=1 Tax=OCS116 cluster bacterium TaxID=2030921 RepID=A0A2A4YZV3_9PROT|nr:prolipoprotein diacylglyceryl transferase [Paracoccaceae bacterium]
MQAAILFPNISPEIFTIPLFGMEFSLRWYALAYIFGILIGWSIARKAALHGRLWPNGLALMTAEQLENLMTWAIMGIIIGGRLGYVIFYNPAHFIANPAQIPMIWQGGMSFHGGFLGVVVAVAIFARREALALGSVADLAAMAATPGLLLGRLANFINAELWGRPTDQPWGVIFPGQAAQTCADVAGPCARHPSQLYEAGLEGLLLGAILLTAGFAFRATRRRWQLTGMFITGYGIARIIIENFRQPDAQFVSEGNPIGLIIQFGDWGLTSDWGLTMGQALSIPMVLIGLLVIIAARRGAAPVTA